LKFVEKNLEMAIKGGKQYDIDHRILRPDGKVIWVHAQGELVGDADGNPESLLCTVVDITERKGAEEAIQQSEEKMRIIIKSSPIGIRIAQQGRYAYVNNSFLQMFGYDSSDEILGLPIETLYAPEQRELVKKRQQNRLSGKDISAHFEGKGLKKNGRIFEVSIWQTKIDFEGEPATLAFLVDVNEEKTLRRQLEQSQKMEAIGTLAGGIAHDFNNILTAIIGYTELALMKSKGTLVEADLREVCTAGKRASDLVKQILAFSRQSKPEVKPIQVKGIANEALKLLRPSLPATIEIRTNIQSDALIMADPAQIHQVLMNICTNAGHAMQKEGGSLEISLTDIRLGSDFTSRHPDLKPGAFIKLTMRDTGHGIAPDLLDKIFDPFFTTKEKGEGTGLGLSVVHGIVKTLGGAITVDSEPEKGAEFNVYLPVIEREVKEGLREFEAPLPIGTERILFVDDEEPIRDMSKKLIESLGYHVEVRSNAVEAFELFKANPERFDLIITDMTMPGKTGDRLAEQVMAIRLDIPVILCTGFSTKMDKEKALAVGIKAFALKPIIKSDIAEIIRKVLDEVKSC